jgi:hypothetical protein
MEPIANNLHLFFVLKKDLLLQTDSPNPMSKPKATGQAFTVSLKGAGRHHIWQKQ